MIEYKNRNLSKPYPSHPVFYNHTEPKLFTSITSSSTNRSESNFSTTKYSFKTGTHKNFYTTKPNFLQFTHSKLNLKINPIFSPQIINKNTFTPTNQLSYATNTHPGRSKSQNIYHSKFEPISDPRINNFTGIKSTNSHKNLQQENLVRFERKRELQKQNMMLKKSISQKRVRFEQHFNGLNLKIGYLKNEYRNKEQKMAKITSVIREYFG